MGKERELARNGEGFAFFLDFRISLNYFLRKIILHHVATPIDKEWLVNKHVSTRCCKR